MIQCDTGGNADIKRLFHAVHRYLDQRVALLAVFRIDPVNFIAKKEGYLGWRVKVGQHNRPLVLLEPHNTVALGPELCERWFVVALERYACFGAKRCFVNLSGNLVGKVGQPSILLEGRVRRVAAKNDFLDAKAVARAKESTYVVSRANIVGKKDNLGHHSLLYTSKTPMVSATIELMDEVKIQERRREQDEQATMQRAAILGLQYLDLRPIEATLPLIKDVLEIPEMYKGRIVPLIPGNDAEPWQFGITTQTPQSVAQALTRSYAEKAQNTVFYLISNSGFRALMERFDPPKKVVYDDIKIASQGDSETIAAVSQTLNSVGTDELFNFLLDQADKLGASDIHIENQRTHIRVRMRVDGALHPVADLEKDRYRVIMGELASRANVSSASSEPQSGHMQREISRDGAAHLLNIRVETVPTLYGQDAVLRLFNFDESMLNLDRLGLGATERHEIDSVVSHPRGMVLMVGPTGSGKSTTLYSMINALNSSDRKIITLEDPIEYGISGIAQIPIDTTEGQSFADGLRSVLRLDPDVVMVGEIRDSDTAKTAIQASITGHLVLSTFHANSTSAAFSRMIDLIGVNPIFSSAIRLVIAQRLVRQLDSNKEEYEPDEATKKWVRDTLKDLPDHIERPNLDEFKLWRPVPSDGSPFGYKGRIVIMEQMVVNEPIQAFLRGDVADVHTEVIEKAARQAGMVTLLEAGVLAALRGETTLEEVNRVI